MVIRTSTLPYLSPKHLSVLSGPFQHHPRPTMIKKSNNQVINQLQPQGLLIIQYGGSGRREAYSHRVEKQIPRVEVGYQYTTKTNIKLMFHFHAKKTQSYKIHVCIPNICETLIKIMACVQTTECHLNTLAKNLAYLMAKNVASS